MLEVCRSTALTRHSTSPLSSTRIQQIFFSLTSAAPNLARVISLGTSAMEVPHLPVVRLQISVLYCLDLMLFKTLTLTTAPLNTTALLALPAIAGESLRIFQAHDVAWMDTCSLVQEGPTVPFRIIHYLWKSVLGISISTVSGHSQPLYRSAIALQRIKIPPLQIFKWSPYTTPEQYYTFKFI